MFSSLISSMLAKVILYYRLANDITHAALIKSIPHFPIHNVFSYTLPHLPLKKHNPRLR